MSRKRTRPKELPLNQLPELTRIDPDELFDIYRIFQEAGVDFALFEDQNGKYVLFVDKHRHLNAIDAGIFAQCVGMFFGKDSDNGATQSRKNLALHQNFLQQLREIDPKANAPLFERLRFYEVTHSVVWQLLQNLTRLNNQEIELLRTATTSDDTFLSVTFDQQNGEIESFYFTDVSGTQKGIPTEQLGLLAGFMAPVKDAGMQLERQKQLEKDFTYLTGKKGSYVLPVRAQIEPLLYEFMSSLDSASEGNGGKIRSLSRLEQEKFRFRRELLNYLNKQLRPHGIEVLDAKKLAQEGSDIKYVTKNAHLVNQFPVADLIFVRKASGSVVDLVPVDLHGWKTPPRKNEEKPSDTTPYGGVVGVVIVDNDDDVTTRKHQARNAAGQLRRYLPEVPHATLSRPSVLTVDRNLFEHWQSSGALVSTEAIAEIKARPDKKKLADYGYLVSNGPPTVELHTYEPGGKSHIGGTQLTLVVRYGDVSHAVMLDRGWLFDHVPSWSALGRQPAYVEGIAPFLRNKMFDTIPRLYRTDLLTNSVSAGMLKRVADKANQISERYAFDSVDEFVLLELFHRLGERDFVQMLREKANPTTGQLLRSGEIKQLIAKLKQREKTIYSRKTFHDMLAITHAHQDHSIGSSFVRDEVVRGWSPVTLAMLRADHRISSNWYVQDTAIRKMREQKKIGSAYPVFAYPYTPFEDGKKVEVSPGVFLTPIEVYHSVPGSMGFHVDVTHKGKKLTSVSYGGDYRDARFFDMVGHLGGTDLLVVEGTNPPSASGKKESFHFNEKDVMNNFDKEIGHANDASLAVVVDLVKNGFERLFNIMQVAEARGRTVVISPKIAQRLRFIQLAIKESKASEPVFGPLPDITPGDPRIRVWKPRKGSYSTAEKEAFELWQTITPDQVAASPQHFIVIRENEQPEKLDGIGSNVLWIDSTYQAYDEPARKVKGYMRRYATRQGWKYVTMGFHASGHAPLMSPEDDPDGEGILAQLHKAKPKEVLPVHTQRRGEVAQVIRSYPGMKDVNVRSQVQHPRFKIRLRGPSSSG